MEGKKKKSKKKKGNNAKLNDSVSIEGDIDQTKPEDFISNVIVVPDYKNGASFEVNHHNEAPSSAVSQSFGVSALGLEQERHILEENNEELQEEISKVGVVKNSLSNKEDNLGEIIKHLRDEVGSCVQREVSLANRITDFQSKNASLTLREDGLEERIKRLEEMNQSFALEKSSIKEVVSNLGEANEGLQMQVMELKESRDSLTEENKHLTERISTLESRIQHLETVVSFYDSSKVSEIVEPEKSEIEEAADDSSPLKNLTSTNFVSESEEKILDSDENIQAMATNLETSIVNGHANFIAEDQPQQIQLLGLHDSMTSEAVVPVPLDDIVQELQQPMAEQTVPISDAPLTGAPFRLISFLTRYVSGADLVDRPSSGR